MSTLKEGYHSLPQLLHISDVLLVTTSLPLQISFGGENYPFRCFHTLPFLTEAFRGHGLFKIAGERLESSEEALCRSIEADDPPHFLSLQVY